MSIIQQVPWTVQPQYPARYSSEFAGNIGDVLLPPLGLTTPEGIKVTCSGTHVRAPGIGGVASRFNADYLLRAPIADSNLGISNGGSLLVVFRTTATGATDGRLAAYGSDSGSSGNTIFSIGQNVASLRVTIGGSNGNEAFEYAVNINDGKLHCAAISVYSFANAAVSQYAVAFDGRILANSTTAGALGALNAYKYVVAGGFRRGGSDFASGVGDVYLVSPLYKSPLSADQLAKLTAGNTYRQIFAPQTRRIWAPSAGGAVTGTVAVTDAGDVAYAAGKIGTKGAAAITEAGDAASAAGKIGTVGAVAVTETGDVVSASGTVGSASGVTGTAAITESSDIAAGSGKVGTKGAIAVIEAGDIIVAAGKVGRKGAAAIVEAGDIAYAAVADYHGFTAEQFSWLDARFAAIPAAVLAAAQVTPIAAEIIKVAGETVIGAGTEADPWGPA